MRTPIALVAATLALSLSACGSGGKAAAPAAPHEPIPFAQVDLQGWTQEMRAAGAARVGRDTYSAVLPFCADTVDELALTLTLRGAQPELYRIGMKYICPSQAHKVDDALRQNQDVMSKLNEACALAPNQRTQDQRDMVEAVGCS